MTTRRDIDTRLSDAEHLLTPRRCQWLDFIMGFSVKDEIARLSDLRDDEMAANVLDWERLGKINYEIHVMTELVEHPFDMDVQDYARGVYNAN